MQRQLLLASLVLFIGCTAARRGAQPPKPSALSVMGLKLGMSETAVAEALSLSQKGETKQAPGGYVAYTAGLVADVPNAELEIDGAV